MGIAKYYAQEYIYYVNYLNHITMKILYSVFSVLMTTLLIGQTTASKEDFRTIDNISLCKKIFTVKAKYSETDFSLQICTKDSCYGPTQDFSRTIVSTSLTNAVINFVISEIDTTITNSSITNDERDYLGQLLNKVNVLVDSDKTELQKILVATDKVSDTKSGVLKLNKKVPFTQEEKCKQEGENQETLFVNEELIIKEASIQFFNNKATTIFIQAELKKDSKSESLTFLNNKFSIPLRSFNYDGYSLVSKTKAGKCIRIDINDVFDYVNDEFFNYSIANSQHVLKTDNPNNSQQKITQRRFFDFFTAVIYSDVMGFNTENSNSLLNAQATLLIPMNQKNDRQWTAARQFLTTTNISLNNSFENETRFMSFKGDDKINHFDLLRKNNFYGRIALDLLTYESKGWFLNTSLGYSTSFYRTGFRYTEIVTDGQDIISDGQLFSLGHGPYLNFEFRPQTNFGADINIGLEDLNYNDTRVVGERDFGKDVFNDNGSDYFIFQHNLVNISANFYWLANPLKSSGGIYAKVGTAYHTPSRSIFPQLLVGYATNLTSFVNRFKPKSSSDESK